MAAPLTASTSANGAAGPPSTTLTSTTNGKKRLALQDRDLSILSLPCRDEPNYYDSPPSSPPPLPFPPTHPSYPTSLLRTEPSHSISKPITYSNRGHKLDPLAPFIHPTKLGHHSHVDRGFSPPRTCSSLKRRKLNDLSSTSTSDGFLVAPNLELLPRSTVSSSTKETTTFSNPNSEPFPSYLSPTPQSPLDLILLPHVQFTFGTKNVMFHLLSESTTRLIEQENELLASLKGVCRGLRGEGFEWRWQGDVEREIERRGKREEKEKALEVERKERERVRKEDKETREGEKRRRAEIVRHEKEEEERKERERVDAEVEAEEVRKREQAAAAAAAKEEEVIKPEPDQTPTLEAREPVKGVEYAQGIPTAVGGDDTEMTDDTTTTILAMPTPSSLPSLPLPVFPFPSTADPSNNTLSTLASEEPNPTTPATETPTQPVVENSGTTADRSSSLPLALPEATSTAFETSVQVSDPTRPSQSTEPSAPTSANPEPASEGGEMHESKEPSLSSIAPLTTSTRGAASEGGQIERETRMEGIEEEQVQPQPEPVHVPTTTVEEPSVTFIEPTGTTTEPSTPLIDVASEPPSTRQSAAAAAETPILSTSEATPIEQQPSTGTLNPSTTATTAAATGTEEEEEGRVEGPEETEPEPEEPSIRRSGRNTRATIGLRASQLQFEDGIGIGGSAGGGGGGGSQRGLSFSPDPYSVQMNGGGGGGEELESGRNTPTNGRQGPGITPQEEEEDGEEEEEEEEEEPLISIEDLPEYAHRLIDPESYVKTLFVSEGPVEMEKLSTTTTVPGQAPGGTGGDKEMLSCNEQEALVHDCLTDLHRFLSDTLEYRNRLSEIRDGILEVERRRKGMWKVVRTVALDWLEEEAAGGANAGGAGTGGVGTSATADSRLGGTGLAGNGLTVGGQGVYEVYE